MNSTSDKARAIRLRRERVLRRDDPFVRPVELTKDAWVLWAAYDLASFPALKKSPTEDGAFKKPEEFFAYFKMFAAGKASVLMIEANHKFFREKRGPVAMVSIDNYGWRVEPQFEFFHWATPRQRLSAVVAFLHMIRFSKEVGVCVVRVADKDVSFCEHLYAYDLLRCVGNIPNAREDGTESLFALKCRRQNKLELVVSDRKAA